MKTRYSAAAAFVIVALPLFARAVDLTKIDRSIAKEPVYQNKPEYCLFVFGPDAKTRVCGVLDGEVLFVDRNGNGDLTDANERIVNPEKKSFPAASKVYRTYSAGNITAPVGKIYESLTIHDVEHLGRRYVQCEVKAFANHNQHGGLGGDAELRFAESRSAAPVVHFDGPLKMNGINLRLERGREKPLHIYAAVGTQGIRSSAEIAHDNVDRNIHPVAVIEFPANLPGKEGPKVMVHLTHRC